jgi:hypothetical protein
VAGTLGKILGDIRVGVRYDRAHVCIYLVLCNIGFVRFACLILLVNMMDYCGYVYAVVG